MLLDLLRKLFEGKKYLKAKKHQSICSDAGIGSRLELDMFKPLPKSLYEVWLAVSEQPGKDPENFEDGIMNWGRRIDYRTRIRTTNLRTASRQRAAWHVMGNMNPMKSGKCGESQRRKCIGPVDPQHRHAVARITSSFSPQPQCPRTRFRFSIVVWRFFEVLVPRTLICVRFHGSGGRVSTGKLVPHGELRVASADTIPPLVLGHLRKIGLYNFMHGF
jgi:hypothetical protein